MKPPTPTGPADPLPDFSNVTPETVRQIGADALGEAEGIVAAIEHLAAGEPTLTSTFGALEDASCLVSDAYGRGAFMARVHPDAAVRAEAAALEERLERWRTDLLFRRPLYERLADFAGSSAAGALSPLERRLIEFWLRDFRRAGHELGAADRERLQALRRRLVALEVAFAKNLDDYHDHIEIDTESMAGLPEEYLARLDPGAEPGTKRVSMDLPDYRPFMEEAHDRSARRLLQHKFWNRAAEANQPLLEEAVAIRDEIAALLGYATWAHYAMEPKMARHPKAVAEFYDQIVPALTEKAAAELQRLQTRHEAEHPGEAVQSWDWMYLHNQQRKEEYGVDVHEVAEYFELGRVLDGMFDLAGDVFGLEFRPIADAATWHPDVRTYAIHDRDGDAPIAYFYADLFPREGKYGHAAAFPIVVGRRLADGSYRPPVTAVVANFTKPAADRPSLLPHSEALTLFHEFGHVLHSCLTTVEVPRFAGFSTEWDFVEAPSQIMEHWLWRAEILQRFARHHLTGEPIPDDMVRRLVAARDQNIGLQTMRQVYLGKLDLALHDGRPRDVDAIYREAYAYTLLPFHEGTFFPASFGHLMGGYDAGYYGYLWARVYGDDMFSVFEREGVTSPDVGARYRSEVLATGGARDAVEHLRAFLGREPSPEAFLRRLGLSG